MAPPSLDDGWSSPFLFSTPISSDRFTVAVRAINRYAVPAAPNPAGVRAAIQINFTSPRSRAPPPEVFFTGSDKTWVSSRIFGNGWQQPGYSDGDWTPAEVMPQSANNTVVWGPMNAPDRLWFATSGPQPGTLNCDASNGNGNGVGPAGSGQKDGIVLSKAGLGVHLPAPLLVAHLHGL